MNHGAFLLLGLFLAFAGTWSAMIFVPFLHVGRQQPVVQRDTGLLYPEARPGLAAEGAAVYRSMGCVACHTQQVRPEGYGSDYERGWGNRRTVARDYLYDATVQWGSLRVGPDLANVGRRPYDATWHLLHLYNPRTVVSNSVMPAYPFLFEVRRAESVANTNALPLPTWAKDPAYEVVPKPAARALAAYMLSLRSEAMLFETPHPATNTTNQVSAEAASTNGTNVSAAPPSTNASAANKP